MYSRDKQYGLITSFVISVLLVLVYLLSTLKPRMIKQTDLSLVSGNGAIVALDASFEKKSPTSKTNDWISLRLTMPKYIDKLSSCGVGQSLIVAESPFVAEQIPVALQTMQTSGMCESFHGIMPTKVTIYRRMSLQYFEEESSEEINFLHIVSK